MTMRPTSAPATSAQTYPAPRGSSTIATSPTTVHAASRSVRYRSPSPVGEGMRGSRAATTAHAPPARATTAATTAAGVSGQTVPAATASHRSGRPARTTRAAGEAMRARGTPAVCERGPGRRLGAPGAGAARRPPSGPPSPRCAPSRESSLDPRPRPHTRSPPHLHPEVDAPRPPRREPDHHRRAGPARGTREGEDERDAAGGHRHRGAGMDRLEPAAGTAVLAAPAAGRGGPRDHRPRRDRVHRRRRTRCRWWGGRCW